MSAFRLLFISGLIVLTLSSFKFKNIQNDHDWRLKLAQAVKELGKANRGKHGQLTKVPVKRTYIGGMGEVCSRNTFVENQNAFVKEIFIKKPKTSDIWANDRLFVDIYECPSVHEASVLAAKIDTFEVFRSKGIDNECMSNDSTKGYTVYCCDVLHAHGNYTLFQYYNVIIVLVDDSGRNPIFPNIKNDFKAYFKNNYPLNTPKG